MLATLNGTDFKEVVLGKLLESGGREVITYSRCAFLINFNFMLVDQSGTNP